MDEKQLRANLDSQIKTLLAEIEQIVPVKFTLWDEDYCACQLHKDANGNQIEAEIFYKEPVSQAKFAHELLHAKTTEMREARRQLIENSKMSYMDIDN